MTNPLDRMCKALRVAAMTMGFLSAATLCVPGALAMGTGRLEGVVVDEKGEPIVGIELKFSPTDDSTNVARSLKADKKGKFQHAFFPAGQYKVGLTGADWFIRSMTYILKDENGSEVMNQTGDADPEKGPAPFQVVFGQRAELKIVLSTKESHTALLRQVELANASGPVKEMQEAYAAGNMTAVVEQADKLLKKSPDIAQAHYLRGIALVRLDRNDEAAQALQRAFDLSPDQPGVEGALGVALVQKAQSLEKTGKKDDAAVLYAKAADHLGRELERMPDSASFLSNRAVALEATGRTPELKSTLEKLLKIDPASVPVRLGLANLAFKDNRSDDAITLLDQAPKTDKAFAVTYYNIAASRFNNGEVPAAIATAKKGIALDPDLAPLHRLLGLAYIRSGENALAIEALEKVLKLVPSGPEAEEDRKMLEALKKAH